MSDLIEVVQKLDPGSELVELYELYLSDTDVLYFHPGLDGSLPKIQFRERSNPYNIKTYEPLPVEMDDITLSAEGPSPRPTLTIANVLNTFSEALSGLKNKDLIGKSIIKRTTLKKYLFQPGGNFNTQEPPIEFPIKKYIIDRIQSETNTEVDFELTAPYDISGRKLPNRTVIGKYCSWQYQGNELLSKGGCIWSKNSIIKYVDSSSGAVRSHRAYFTFDNKPIVPSTAASAMSTAGWASNEYETFVVYNSSDNYTAGDYVQYTANNRTTVYKCLVDNNDQNPIDSIGYWELGDVCGKRLESCKCRFQFKPEDSTQDNSIPSKDEKNTNKMLPFGSFIGASKFR